jgi:hypothetical protein
MRSKNSKIQPLVSKSTRNLFFSITLKILILIALIQLGTALLILGPNLIRAAIALLPHRTPSNPEKLLPIIAEPQKKAPPLSLQSESRATHNEALAKNEPPLIEGNNLQPGATLSIIDIRHTHGNLGEQTLKIAIKSQTEEPVSIPDVKVQVYFYDQQGEEIVPSKVPVASRWLHSPVEWKDREPEILEVTYQPETVTPDLYYLGYVIAVYYKGELQSYRADPVRLTNQFPIKVFIGHHEI